MESPRSIFRVRETLLNQRPDPLAAVSMAMVTLGVILFSIASWTDFLGASSWMSASREEVFNHHDYWRAWTTLFVHGDGKHLLSNSFLFFVLGTFLTGYFGIALVLVSAFFLGGITNLLVLSQMPLPVHLIGLSGVVFWMGGAWLTLYFLIERRRSLVQRLIRAFGVALVVFMPAEAFDPSISYKSHFVGFILGVLFGVFYYFLARKKLAAAEVFELVEEEESLEPTTTNAESPENGAF